MCGAEQTKKKARFVADAWPGGEKKDVISCDKLGEAQMTLDPEISVGTNPVIFKRHDPTLQLEANGRNRKEF